MTDHDDALLPTDPVEAEAGFESGVCPRCLMHDELYDHGPKPEHWVVCHGCRTRWYFASGLYCFGRHETEEQRQYAYDDDPGWGDYEVVEPLYGPPPLDPSELTLEGGGGG